MIGLADEGREEELRRLVTLSLEVEALEALVVRLARAGVIGNPSLAGEARTAQLAAGMALGDADQVFGTARDLPVALARGTSLEVILGQIYGVAGDPGLGRGLPGALCDAAHGVSLTDGSSASHLVHAAGFGHAAALQSADRIALGCFGSSAWDNGEIHAALNFASVYRARVIFLARGPLAGAPPMDEVVEAWGLEGTRVPADDGLAILDAVAAARARAVAGEGPSIVDARFEGTLEPRDAQALQALAGWPREVSERVHGDIETRLTAAREAVEQAPGVAPETLFDEVYAARPWWLEEQARDGRSSW